MRWKGKDGVASLRFMIDMSCSMNGTPYMTCELDTEGVCLVGYAGVHDGANMGDLERDYLVLFLPCPQYHARKSLCNLRTLKPSRINFMRQQQYLAIILRETIYCVAN